MRSFEFVLEDDDEMAPEDREVAKLTTHVAFTTSDKNRSEKNETDRVDSCPICSPDSVVHSGTETPQNFSALPNALANSTKK